MALISAFSFATSDALTKKALVHGNIYLVAWFRIIFSLPFLLSLLFVIPWPQLDRSFYLFFAAALPLEILALILYMKALKASPLSLTLPFLALTPVFLIFVSYIIVGEKVSLQGFIGIVVLAAGGYALQLHQMQKGYLEPFKALLKEKGSLLMICVALIYSMTSSLGKMAIEHSSPLFFGITYFFMLSILFAPVALWMGRHDFKPFIFKKQFRSLFLPGMFFAVMIMSHMIAISLTKVAYMMSVKRMSIVIGVIYGYLIFKETNVRERILGASLMFAGFILIVTAS